MSSATALPRRLRPRRGALLMLGATLLFAAMGVMVKLASAELPAVEIMLGRNGFGLLALMPWLATGRAGGLATRRLGGHLLRTAAGLGAMACYFHALGRLRLADATLLNFSLPLFIPLVARVLLGEHFPRRLWQVLGIGFFGLVLILKPGAGLWESAALVGMFAGMLGAVAQVAVRGLTLTEPPTRIVFYFAAISTSIVALPAALAWSPPSPKLWAALVASGTFATIGQLMLTAAYAEAPAAQVGPFLYATVVFAALFDWGIWGQLPDASTAAGAVLVMAAGVLAVRWMDPALIAPTRPAPVPPRALPAHAAARPPDP